MVDWFGDFKKMGGDDALLYTSRRTYDVELVLAHLDDGWSEGLV
jgi:hypothetical protein